MFKKIKKWINELRYKYAMWKMNRRYNRIRREIGKALLPFVRQCLNEIDGIND